VPADKKRIIKNFSIGIIYTGKFLNGYLKGSIGFELLK